MINALRSNDCFIYMLNEQGEAEAYPCRADAILRVKASEGGKIVMTSLEDGGLRIAAEAETGYVFNGWADSDGDSIDFSKGFDEMTTVIAGFRVN